MTNKKHPNHLAIIMDGNGRWAIKKNLKRNSGHEAGLNTLAKIIEKVFNFNIKHFTVYAFSSENWGRPKKEVKSLLALFEKAIDENFEFLYKNKIRFRLLGDKSRFPKSLVSKINTLEEDTKNFRKYNFYLAANYGSRGEIINSFVHLLKSKIKKINEKSFKKYLYIPDLPDVDLLIRTGGETRLSNFLLWQSAYAEIYFSKVLWPDFKISHLKSAIKFFEKKERRFGSVN